MTARIEPAPEPVGGASPTVAELLRRTLDAQGMSQIELATQTQLSTKHINQIMQGEAGLSPHCAWLIGHATGIPAEVWITLQAVHAVRKITREVPPPGEPITPKLRRQRDDARRERDQALAALDSARAEIEQLRGHDANTLARRLADRTDEVMQLRREFGEFRDTCTEHSVERAAEQVRLEDAEAALTRYGDELVRLADAATRFRAERDDARHLVQRALDRWHPTWRTELRRTAWYLDTSTDAIDWLTDTRKGH